MTHLTRRLALGAAVGALVVPATAQAISGKNLTGEYTVEGRNPNGSAYSGTAKLEQTGSVVEVTWTVGGQTYKGLGPLQGRVLTVEWGADAPVVYVLMPDGALYGTWANGTGLDKLTPK